MCFAERVTIPRCCGRSEMVFPKDIMWLAGAPGAGKATLTPHIMELRQLTLNPIEISSLLTTPELTAKKEAGELVGDEAVTGWQTSCRVITIITIIVIIIIIIIITKKVPCAITTCKT